MLCPLCDFLYIIQTLSHDLSDEPKKTRKELSYNIFSKETGILEIPLHLQAKTCATLPYLYFFFLFGLGFSQPKCIYSV